MAKTVGVRRVVWLAMCFALLAALALAVSVSSSTVAADAQNAAESIYVADYANADITGWNDITGGVVLVPYQLDSGPPVPGIGSSFSLSYEGTLSGVAGTGYFIPARKIGNDLYFRPDDVGTPPVIGSTFSATFELQAPPVPDAGFALAGSNVLQYFSGFTGSTSNVIAQLQSPYALIDHGQTGEYIWDVEVGGLGDTIINSPRYDSRGVYFDGGIASDNPATQTYLSYVTTTSQESCNGLLVTVDIGAGEMPTDGDDVIMGTPAADTINGLAGDDTICGEGGADVINGGGGVDTVFGGDGDDTVGGQGDGDFLYGDDGDDRINGGVGADVIEGGEGDDDLRGQGDADTLNGGNGVDQLLGGSGNDILNAGDGGNLGTAQLVRGQGNNDIITGSPQDDDLEGGSGLDELYGKGGNDRLRGGNASDDLYGGPGVDTLEGGGSRDFLYGGLGNDTLLGGTGNDDLFGDGGNDDLVGQGDVDSCDGGAGVDTAAATCETLVDVP